MNYNQPEIIVIGSGRSGTSTVARICHEQLDICMGHFIKGPDEMNPGGYYEDMVSHGFVRTMTDNVFGAETYLQMMNEFHKRCSQWGVKDPWFLYLPEKILQGIKPTLCVLCVRDLDSTVKSWLKIYKASSGQEPDDKITQYYYKLSDDRTRAGLKLTQDLWTNHIILDFTKRLTDEEIKNKIESKLGGTNESV